MAYRVLIVRELLTRICDFHTDEAVTFIKKARNTGLLQRLDTIHLRQQDIFAAGECGNVGVFELVSNQRILETDRYVATYAATSGNLDVLTWLYKKDPSYIYDGLDEIAARHNQFHIVKWLYANNIIKYSSWVIEHAAMIGDLDAVKWICENTAQECTYPAFKNAISGGHLKTAKWIHKNIPERIGSSRYDFVASAYSSGNLKLIKWICGIYGFISVQIGLINAAAEGHLHIMQLLHNNHAYDKHFVTTMIIDDAAKNGNLDIIEWASANLNSGYTRATTDAMDLAASNGHLHIIKWLYSHRTEGCTSSAFDYAAEKGHLHVIKWLITKYPDKYMISANDIAASYGHLEILEWVFQEYPHLGHVTSLAIAYAAGNGHLEVVKFLSKSSPATTSAMNQALFNNKLDVVYWLHKNRTEGCTSYGLSKSIFGIGTPNIVKWIKQHYNDAYISGFHEAIQAAVKSGRMSVIKWMYYNDTNLLTRADIDNLIRIAENAGYIYIKKWLESKIGKEP